jgi:hypothetical protein
VLPTLLIAALHPLLIGAVLAKQIPQAGATDLARGHTPFAGYRSQRRGMSVWHDWIDWIGGYPFEVAQPGEVFSFLRDRAAASRDAHYSGQCNNEYLAVALPD